jgi:hypothetical protein
LVDDEEYRVRLFQVLAPYANKVEGESSTFFVLFAHQNLGSDSSSAVAGVGVGAAGVGQRHHQFSAEARLIFVSHALAAHVGARVQHRDRVQSRAG